MPPKGPADKKKQRRQLLIYGGVGAVFLLIFMLSRGKGHGGGGPPPGGEAPIAPVASPAADGVGPAGIDNAAQLAGFESSLLNTLPESITNSIAAGFANYTPPEPPPPREPGQAAPLNPQGDTIASTLGALAAFEGSQAKIFGTGLAGEQNGAAKAGGRHAQHGSGKRKGRPHPGHRPSGPAQHPGGGHHHQPTARIPNRPTGGAYQRHGAKPSPRRRHR